MKNKSFGPLGEVNVFPIKVLYITTLMGNMGGAEKNIYDIACNIDKERFTPYVFCLKGGELIEKLKSNGVHAEIIDLSKIFGFDSLKKAFRLIRFIRGQKINIVVTYHHDADIWGGIIAKLAGVPVVISSRRDMGYQLESKHIWAYRILNRLFTKIVAVSEAVKNEVAKREWTSPKKIIIVYNGVQFNDNSINVDNNEINNIKKTLGIDSSNIVVGTLGAFRPIKGQTFLVKAIAEVVKKYNNIVVLFVGSRDTDYFVEVEQLVKRFKLEKHVRFVGHQEEAIKILSIFDIYICSSVSEGFSNAILEAMMAGKPVIASNSGGNSEVVVDNITGLLIPPCNPKAIANALEVLLMNSGKMKSMGVECRLLVSKKFMLKNMIERTEELYEYLLKKKFTLRSSALKPLLRKKIKKHVKLMLSNIFYISGITYIYKKMYPINLRILAYHSINKVTIGPLEIEQDTENYEKQMVFLKDNYDIISLQELREYRNTKRAYPNNSVLITFDDGYKDNYLNAYPILTKYNIPAIIFLTTDPIEKNEPLFYDALRFGIVNTANLILDMKDYGLKKYLINLRDETSLAEIIKEITYYSKGLDKSLKDNLIRVIYYRLGLEWQDILNKELYLSWDEIIEMSQNGIEIGSHTKSHPQLTSLTYDECKEELIISKKLIEEKIGKRLRVFAYPFGGRNDLNKMVEKAAQEAGYEFAFSLYEDRQMQDQLEFTLGRRLVDSHMVVDNNGIFSEALFSNSMVDLV